MDWTKVLCSEADLRSLDRVEQIPAPADLAGGNLGRRAGSEGWGHVGRSGCAARLAGPARGRGVRARGRRARARRAWAQCTLHARRRAFAPAQTTSSRRRSARAPAASAQSPARPSLATRRSRTIGARRSSSPSRRCHGRACPTTCMAPPSTAPTRSRGSRWAGARCSRRTRPTARRCPSSGARCASSSPGTRCGRSTTTSARTRPSTSSRATARCAGATPRTRRVPRGRGDGARPSAAAGRAAAQGERGAARWHAGRMAAVPDGAR